MCINYQKGACPWDNCRFKHEVTVLDKAEDQAQVYAGMIQVHMADASGTRPYLADKILIDGGSNELIRPRKPEMWREIVAGRKGANRVDIKLAGGRFEPGGMTASGEVMVGPGHKPDTSTVRWIVPDNRLTDELGIRITKFAGSVFLDRGPLTRKTN